MAQYFLLIKPLSRGKGTHVTRAAAYRAGESIRDEREGRLYNYSHRNDVAHKEIVLPSHLADSTAMSWARDRSTLWNAAEHAGQRRNSRVGREVLVLLPSELSASQRTNLVRQFSQNLANKYQNAIDVTIHPPRPGADERHHHAHLLMTTREVTAEGLGRRTSIELGGRERQARGLGHMREEYVWVRERWAHATNKALHEAGLSSRVDHRSYRDQGIDREPVPMIPQKIHYAERRSGRSTQAGDAIRARYRERVEARLKGGDELARVLQRQKEEARQRAIAADSVRKWEEMRARLPPTPTMEESVRNWEKYWQSLPPQPTPEDSVKKWLEYREHAPPQPTAADSVRKWEEMWERQRGYERSGVGSPERSHGPGFGNNADRDEETPGRKIDRSYDNDYGL